MQANSSLAWDVSSIPFLPTLYFAPTAGVFPLPLHATTLAFNLTTPLLPRTSPAPTNLLTITLYTLLNARTITVLVRMITLYGVLKSGGR